MAEDKTAANALNKLLLCAGLDVHNTIYNMHLENRLNLIFTCGWEAVINHLQSPL